MTAIKTREQKARRRLARRGYILNKGRQAAAGLGSGYMVVEAESNTVAIGAHHWAFDATLDDVEDFLAAA
jgi:hypothetical protein